MANYPRVVAGRRAYIRPPRSGFAIDQPLSPATSTPLIHMRDLAQVMAYARTGKTGRRYGVALLEKKRLAAHSVRPCAWH